MKIQHCFRFLFGIALIAGYQPSAIADEFKRDYDFSTPLPQTGKVTIRKPLEALPLKSLFDRCPAKSHLEEFAQSTHFLVMICRDDTNDLKKYWIQKALKNGKVRKLIAEDRPNSQPVAWQSEDYKVSIYADGARPESLNAYLESYNTKTQQGRAEALLYHYSKFYTQP
ncbi:DUF928 domain-containing protein [Tumidithrix helvetica PCC 7403]|uniref:hypothetical protein n=1 Tax=Tumidithrix helvetica TaxID=3457545 RepID=UPI003C9C566C